MKTYKITFFLGTIIAILIINSCKTTYKVQPTIYNPTNDTITSIGYQIDYSVDPSSSAPLLSTKQLLPDSSFTYPKKLKVEQGKNLYLFTGTKRTNTVIYNSKVKIQASNTDLIVGLKPIDTANVYSRSSEIQNWFESVSEGIIDARNRMPNLTSKLSNIMSLLPGIIIVDSTTWKQAVNNNGLLKKNSDKLSFYTASDLRIVPAPIVLGGVDKVKKFRVESNGNIESSFKFPFAANLDLNISSEALYDVKLEILDAGWVSINAQNVTNPLEAIFLLDSIGQVTTLLDMLKQLQKGRKAKIVRNAYMYQSLTIQTTKYEKIETDFSGEYASVLTTNGVYRRSESEDYVNTLPTTITHIEIGNDITEALKSNLELLISAKYIEDKINGKPIDSELLEMVPEQIKSINNNFNKELNKLNNKIENIKKKSKLIQIDKIELLNKAYDTFENKDFSASKEYWSELILLDSSNSEFFSRRGYCYQQIGLIKESLSDYNNAIILEPNRYFYYDNRAEVYYKSKKWDDAYEDLSRSIELNPLRSGKTINNRGLVLIKLNNKTKACEDFKEAMNLKNSDGKLNYEKYCK